MKITSIPELIKKYGSKVNAHRVTGINEQTIGKFQNDVEMKLHVILNDRLMTATLTSPVINLNAENPVHDKRQQKRKKKNGKQESRED